LLAGDGVAVANVLQEHSSGIGAGA